MDKDIYLVGTSDGWEFSIVDAWSSVEDAQAVVDEYNNAKEFYDAPANVMTVTLHATGVRTALSELIEHSQRSDSNETLDPSNLVLPTIREKVTIVAHKVIKDVETRIPETDLSVIHHGPSKVWIIKRLRDGKVQHQWFLPPEGYLSTFMPDSEDPCYLDAMMSWKDSHLDAKFHATIRTFAD